tara:strand:+ start:3028 stop:3174 length:147 start_codon:yes stop_codon:yes gene_type:complete
MKIWFITAALIATLSTAGVEAADIASCSNPSGKGYYPEIGIVKKKESG